MSEVIMLAEKSLQTISGRYVLDISHMGYLSALLDGMGLGDAVKAAVLRCISEKNVPEIEKLCASSGVSSGDCGKLTALASMYGSFERISAPREIGGAPTEDASGRVEASGERSGPWGGREPPPGFSIVNDMNLLQRHYLPGVYRRDPHRHPVRRQV
jgi:ATP phosphoribosyltransferase regulatory subunit